eukprot:snap_masked-scaffold_2-processed-gene-7.34-mRNA-1 protein AED:1.00 eAED:1.00 QI:0/-1/0/0/-1/1/1/0/491
MGGKKRNKNEKLAKNLLARRSNLKFKKSRTESFGVEKVLQKFRDLKSRDGEELGSIILEWLTGSDLEQFENNVFGKKFFQHKHGEKYFSGICSSGILFCAMKAQQLSVEKDFTLSKILKHKRVTKEEVSSTSVRDIIYNESFSIRFLRPQEYLSNLSKLISALESKFKTVGGSNIYLTPKGSQGFAPHYDDVDVFILQIEGKKKWKVYEPTKVAHDKFPLNPRLSSRDFSPDEVNEAVENGDLKLCFDGILSPGSFIYFPRGFVHVAESHPETHSLHITISFMQKYTFGDVLKTSLLSAVESAIHDFNLDEKAAELRKNLPRNFYSLMGIMNSDDENNIEKREELVTQLASQMKQHVLDKVDFDAAADQMCYNFYNERQNPKVFINDSDDEDGENENVELSTEFKLAMKNCGRITLSEDGDSLVVYHSLKSKATEDARGLEYELEDAEILEPILKSDPHKDRFTVNELPGENEDKLRVVQFLLSEGLIIRI